LENDYIYPTNQKEDMADKGGMGDYSDPPKKSTHKIRTNHLLIIGIDSYENGIDDLNNAVRDAVTVKNLLLESYQFSEQNTKVLLNKDATRRNIIRSFEDFIERLTPKDNFVFYFSGHGDMYAPTNRGYWIPADGEPDGRDTWLSNNTISDFMEFMKAHHIFGIVDSCFSGALFRKSTQKNTNTLYYLDSYPSRWLLTAGRETIVPDGVPGTHSPFAKTLISKLKYNPDDALAVSKLCTDVTMSESLDRVNAKPKGSALPLSSSQDGEFIFYKKGYTPVQVKKEKRINTSREINSPQVRIPTSVERQNAPSTTVELSLTEQLKEFVSLGDLDKVFKLLKKSIKPKTKWTNY